MSYIIVCPLENISSAAEAHGCKDMISLMSPGHEFNRPTQIKKDRHLLISMNDVNIETDDLITPGETHVQNLIDFVKTWDQEHPLLIHCWFGVSRSPAAAIISSLVLNPEQNDQDLANRLRAASPSATPNRKIVEIGDKLLNRQGKLVSAVNYIGRGREASNGDNFVLEL